MEGNLLVYNHLQFCILKGSTDVKKGRRTLEGLQEGFDGRLCIVKESPLL